MFLKRVGGILSENANRRSIDSSGVKVTHQSTRTKNYKFGLLTFHQIFCLKVAHFQVGNTTALLYLIKMRRTGSRDMIVLAREV